MTPLRNEINDQRIKIERLKDRSSYYVSLEAKILSLKEDLENKQNTELPQADEEQENEILKLR